MLSHHWTLVWCVARCPPSNKESNVSHLPPPLLTAAHNTNSDGLAHHRCLSSLGLSASVSPASPARHRCWWWGVVVLAVQCVLGSPGRNGEDCPTPLCLLYSDTNIEFLFFSCSFLDSPLNWNISPRSAASLASLVSQQSSEDRHVSSTGARLCALDCGHIIDFTKCKLRQISEL